MVHFHAIMSSFFFTNITLLVLRAYAAPALWSIHFLDHKSNFGLCYYATRCMPIHFMTTWVRFLLLAHSCQCGPGTMFMNIKFWTCMCGAIFPKAYALLSILMKDNLILLWISLASQLEIEDYTIQIDHSKYASDCICKNQKPTWNLIEEIKNKIRGDVRKHLQLVYNGAADLLA